MKVVLIGLTLMLANAWGTEAVMAKELNHDQEDRACSLDDGGKKAITITPAPQGTIPQLWTSSDTCSCSSRRFENSIAIPAAEILLLRRISETCCGSFSIETVTAIGAECPAPYPSKCDTGAFNDAMPIPDGATITQVTLRRGTVAGTNPFTTHGSLSADVCNGGFNGNVALETFDFQAAATATAMCTLSNTAANGDWSECTFNAAGIAAINKAGKTQVRVAFTIDDNDGNGDDYMDYYSRNNATSANHPQLVVTYQP